MADQTEYSGERYDPLQANALAHYDHHARYHFVKRSFHGGRLLDVGCGLGVGAAFLSDSFDEVVGIDANDAAVREATQQRASSRLSFSSVDDFVASSASGFDVVTCLEVIEHTVAQDELLQLLKRAVRPDGVVVISTPNRRWTEHKRIRNPFHVKELHHDEFFALARQAFPHVQAWSQVQVQGACVTQPGSDAAPWTTFSTPGTLPDPALATTNFVAVCSLSARALAQPVSVLDAACTFQTQLEAMITSNERMIDARDVLIREQDELVAALKHERATLAAQLSALELQVARLRRLEEPPDADAMPLRWKLADRANSAFKKTPLHSLLKRAIGR